jgi:hypothetical protein
MSDYKRTAIRRLSVRGFRSIRALERTEIPDLVVLHGPNGAGKSNILQAVQLVLRAAARPEVLPVGPDGSVSLSLKNADNALGLRPEDFHYPGLPEIRVAIDIALGTKATEIVRAPSPLGQLSIELVVQLPADDRIQYWFEHAAVDGLVLDARRIGLNREEGILYQRIRETLLPHLLQVSPAYRVPGDEHDPQDALYGAFVSEDSKEVDAAEHLGQRLAAAGLFGAETSGVALRPVDSRTYNQKQIRFKHPTHGYLPLRSLGSGEQQIVFMLAQRVITPYPIAQIEEPEAHLHTKLMEPFARVLRESVEGDTPDVDQLWIATHHHHFALAPEYFDVRLVDGATQVEKRPREEAMEHFYEPHPYWETLRTLLEDKLLDEETILFEDESGPLRAKDVLSSMRGDRRVANHYVAVATQALVLSLAQERRGT